MSHVDQELITLKEHMVFSGVRVDQSVVFCVVFCRLLFVLLSFFLLVIVFPVLLRFITSVYLFGIFKLFIHY